MFKNNLNLSNYSISIYLSLLLLFISSSIKHTESFFNGGPREYSTIINIISENTLHLQILSLSILFLILFISIYNTKFIPKLNMMIMMFLSLKLWLIIVMLLYNEYTILPLLSILITIIIAMSILILNINIMNAFLILVKIITIFTIFFIILNYYEILINVKSVFWKGRLYGITNHPNFLGGYLALLSPFLLFFIINSKNYYKKIFFIMIFLLLIILIFLTGSRSSLATLIISCIVLFYMYWGVKNTVFSIFFIITLLLISYFSGIFNYFQDADISRLTSTLNTRSGIISELSDIFYYNYLIGNPLLVTATSNSYLAFLARGGIVAGILEFLLIIIIIYNIIMQRKRILLDATFTSVTISFMFYSIFEGAMVENFSLGQILFVLSITYIGVQHDNE